MINLKENDIIKIPKHYKLTQLTEEGTYQLTPQVSLKCDWKRGDLLISNHCRTKAVTFDKFVIQSNNLTGDVESFNSIDNFNVDFFPYSNYNWSVEHFHKATLEEKETLIKVLRENEYDLDEVQHKFVPYSWKPVEGEIYYRLNGKKYQYTSVISLEDGDYFKTLEARDKAVQLLQKVKRS